MDKKKFLDFLSSKLYYLVDSEKNKEINKYSSVIDNYISMGQSEVDAVSSLGNPEDLVLSIYLSYGLDYKKIYGGKMSGKGFIGALKNFYSLLTNKDKKKAINALLYFIYLVLLVILLKVVFIFVRDIGLQIFDEITTNSVVDRIYSVTFNILYVVCAILLFVKLFIKKFK